MAKKTKRKVSQVGGGSSAALRTEAQAVTTPAAPVQTTAAQRATAGRRAAAPVEFNPDYSYVMKDLKRIGTLAGIFFTILIILSFIIR